MPGLEGRPKRRRPGCPTLHIVLLSKEPHERVGGNPFGVRVPPGRGVLKPDNGGAEALCRLEPNYSSAQPRRKRLEFTFLTARIREICERRAAAVAQLGEAAALDLERTLADIDACDDALEFQVLCGDDVVELSGHRWALHFASKYRMELVAGHIKARLTETGATDWGKVTRLRIEVIGGSND